MVGVQELITILIVGLVAGWLSGVLTKGKGFGIAGNILVGIVGALVGGALFRVLGLGAYSVLGRLVTALVGALIFLYLLRKFMKR